MAIRLAAWILDQEFKLANWMAAEDARPVDVLAFQAVLAGMTAPIWAGVAASPYYSIYQLQAATSWAAADVTYTKAMRAKYGRAGAKFRTLTHWNYFPRTLSFASRGGWRFAATRVGSKFLGPVGLALLAYDLWLTGIWVGERLFGEMED